MISVFQFLNIDLPTLQTNLAACGKDVLISHPVLSVAYQDNDNKIYFYALKTKSVKARSERLDRQKQDRSFDW